MSTIVVLLFTEMSEWTTRDACVLGVDQPSVESHYSQKFKKVIQSARGFRHEIYWKSVIERETAVAHMNTYKHLSFTLVCVSVTVCQQAGWPRELHRSMRG